MAQPERLQKILARAGFGSRRGCEELILSGRVTVNGRIAELGQKVDPEKDDIRVDGERLRSPKPFEYYLLHKPTGVLSSDQSQGGHPTVVDLVPSKERLHPVGRLDLDSQGLILLTNDGDLTHRLTHPRYGHEKEYRVLLERPPDRKQLTAWRRGVILADGYRTRPARVWVEKRAKDSAWVRVVMREGRKRQIRETAKALGLRVRRLIRVRIGPIRLGDLPVGAWRPLTPEEVQALRGLTRSVKGRKHEGRKRGKKKSRVRTFHKNKAERHK